MNEDKCDYAIVGSGIAGISCAEMLAGLRESADILVLSPSDLIRRSTATSVTPHVRHIRPHDVTIEEFCRNCANVRVRHAAVVSLDTKNKCLLLSDGCRVTYTLSVCLCAGGRPRQLPVEDRRQSPLGRQNYVLTLRDTESVQHFIGRLKTASRIVIVGNGGIASELVYALTSVHVVWVIRDSYISSTFIDAGCAELLLPHVLSSSSSSSSSSSTTSEPVVSRWKYTVSVTGNVERERLKLRTADGEDGDFSSGDSGGESSSAGVMGSALGPDWLQKLRVGDSAGRRDVAVIYDTQVRRVIYNNTGKWSASVELTNNDVIDCDFVVSATGVIPNSEAFINDRCGVLTGDDGGILVDDKMRTNVAGVFAAGDICTANWQLSPHWHQMRLWGQAREMGEVAAVSMSADEDDDRSPHTIAPLHFELFTHTTQLFGRRLILLGNFNGQSLESNYTALVQLSRRDGGEFVKVVMKDEKIQGALLLGDVDLSETFENLILSQLDVSHLGDDLLSPDIDLEDYFD